MTRMQSFQSNAEASSQTFLSIPPYCTREMLQKSSDVLGSVNGVSYQEYFDNSCHTVLTPSPRKPTTYVSQKEEVCYNVSSVFSLDEENEVTALEGKYCDEFEKPENKNAVCANEHADVSASMENAVCEPPVVGSQGDVGFSADLKSTATEKNTQISHSIPLPTIERDDAYSLVTEHSTLSDSEHSLVSSTKVEVGSQPDLLSTGDSSYDLVSLIGSGVVSKPLIEAQSEGKCKKKKNAKNLKRVSKSVPHVVPLEMQHLNDFSRIVTQEAIHTEMSSGDDAFNVNQDEYQYEDDSSYSSTSDGDVSQTISQDTDELGIDSNSSFPTPTAPPVSEVNSPNESASTASRSENYQDSNSGSILQDEMESRGSVEHCNEHLLTDSYIYQLGVGSNEGLPPHVLDYSKVSLSSESAEQNTGVENSRSPSPRSTRIVTSRSPSTRTAVSASDSTSTTNSPQEERECKTRRLEKLVEKLCEDFVAQNPSVKRDPTTLVSYFENAGAVIRSLPVVQLKCNIRSVSKDTEADGSAENSSQPSSE